jgi:hypothetical protein
MNGTNHLTFAHFREANVRRCLRWHPGGINAWSSSDWLVAITGELGELASLIKMRNRERDGLPGNKFSPTQRQIADEANGIDLGEAVAVKFNEVSQRLGFPENLPVTGDLF